MIAMPSGALGCSTSHRWMRKRLPASHAKVVRAPGASAGLGANEVAMLHSPTKTSSGSSVLWSAGSVIAVLPSRTWERQRLGLRRSPRIIARCGWWCRPYEILRAGEGIEMALEHVQFRPGGLAACFLSGDHLRSSFGAEVRVGQLRLGPRKDAIHGFQLAQEPLACLRDIVRLQLDQDLHRAHCRSHCPERSLAADADLSHPSQRPECGAVLG